VRPLLEGDDVELSGHPADTAALNCDGRFVAFPTSPEKN
jgi:hypothetical protein